MCYELEAAYFEILVYSILLNVCQIAFKMTDTLWKKNLITAKDV
jgi:hypothetical protein